MDMEGCNGSDDFRFEGVEDDDEEELELGDRKRFSGEGSLQQQHGEIVSSVASFDIVVRQQHVPLGPHDWTGARIGCFVLEEADGTSTSFSLYSFCSVFSSRREGVRERSSTAPCSDSRGGKEGRREAGFCSEVNESSHVT